VLQDLSKDFASAEAARQVSSFCISLVLSGKLEKLLVTRNFLLNNASLVQKKACW
jgi:hypothetical protein